MMDTSPHQLPKSWKWTTLGEIGEVVAGGTPSTKDPSNFNGDINWITPADLSGYSKKFIYSGGRNISARGLASSSATLMPAGTILFSSRAPIGYVAISATECATNQGFKNLIPDQQVFNEYVYYYLKASKKMAERHASGTTFKEISGKNFSALPFPLAPKKEQRRIVIKIEELLTKLDAAVLELKEAYVKLKRYRQAVLKTAVTGELTREWREAHKDELESASELLARILKERRAAWEADQVTRMKHKRKVPKNDNRKSSYREPVTPKAEAPESLPLAWAWVTWDEIGFSQNGRLFPSNQYQSTGTKLLRPGNLHISGKVVWTSSNTRYMPRNWEQDFSEFIVQGEELVINLTAQSLRDEFLGRVCLTDSSERCLLNQRIARLMPIRVSRKYLLYVFKSEIFRRFVNTLNTGSLIQHMFTSQLSEFCFPLPSLDEQEQIVAEAERCLSIADSIEQSLDRGLVQADQMRTAILKQAFEGKLIPQDPNDEPAELLLERIKNERAKREAEKQAEAKSNRKGFTNKRPKRTERPAA